MKTKPLHSLLTLSLVSYFAAGALSVAFAGTFKHIAIDGNFTDWAGVPIAYTDPSEEGASAGTDFKDVWLAHDDDYVYVRVSFYNTGDLLRPQNNIFVNADGDTTTGFATHGTGSEMVVQGGNGYQEKNGTFNDGSSIQGLGWASAPAGVTNQFEFRISRHAKYEDGGDVFAGQALGILLETEDNNYAEVDVAMDDGEIAYTLDPAPPKAHGNIDLVSLTGTTWRFNRSGTDLGSAWREITYDDTAAGWESGQGLFGKTPQATAYPASIATPFTDNVTTHYFRAKFAWTQDTAGLSLLASNVLSDGAVFYLNGVEVGRTRMAEGAPSFTTGATGPNPKEGQVEILDLPPNVLFVGENVLAVEVHQSTNDTSDLVFGLSLLASDQLPAAIAAPVTDETLVVDEGSAATLTVTVRGTEPITYQWFKGSNPIAGATNSTFTLNAVSPDDAGAYHVQVSNAEAQNVASPIFTLQTRAVPVSITDPSLPADATVTEGNAASFTVAVAGSLPIEFQWFKDGAAIPDATNQTYVISVALPGSGGQYTCQVSNRVTAPLTSRAAKLVVASDTIPPSLLSVSGGGTRIVLQFSEPLDAATLPAATFALSPAAAISAAHLSTNDATLVTLDSAALTLGTLYTLSVAGVQDRFGNAIGAGTQKQFRATIQIDGDFSDWAGVAMAYSDPQDAGPETGAHSDFKDFWITSDNDYIYVRLTLWEPSDPFIFYNNIFVDADNDPTTGYAFNGIGSDMLVQGGAGFEEQAGTFNAGTVDGLDWLAAPAAPATDFEFRFSRQARFTNADAGGLVFKSDTIALVFESESTGFVTEETAPDAGSGAITHTLLNYTPTDLGALALSRQNGAWTITWGGAGKLQETGSLSPANWQDVSNGRSPYAITGADRQHYYRLTSP